MKPMTYCRKRTQKKSNEELQVLAKTYDFRKTNRFPKEFIYIIENIYSNYIRSLTNTLTARLGAPVKIHIESIVQMKYIDYMGQDSNSNMVTSIFTLNPMEGNVFLNFSNEIAFLCIDSICGGSIHNKQINRNFTEIEKKLVTILSGYFLEPLKKSWHDYFELDPVFKSLEFNLYNMQYITDDESIIIIELSADTGNGQTYPFSYLLPYRSMEKLLEKVVNKSNPTHHVVSPDATSIQLIESKLKDTLIDMNVILGTKDMTLSAINELEVGDVITLNQSVHELLPIVTEDKTYFHVQPGMSNHKVAVQVVEVIDKNLKGV